MKGQVSPVKYLFEMAHIYPQPPEASAPSKDEDSLAETLLDRLNIPKRPLVHDELQKEEDEEVVVIQPKKEEAEATDSDENEDEDKKEAQPEISLCWDEDVDTVELRERVNRELVAVGWERGGVQRSAQRAQRDTEDPPEVRNGRSHTKTEWILPG